MNNDWLSQLAPAYAPLPPGWWPLAPGWWVLGALILLAAAIVLMWVQRPSARRRRFARSELHRLREQAIDPAEAAKAIQNLLRRYALTLFGRDETAHLSGERWLQFIVLAGGDEFAGESGHSLLAAAYGSSHALASETDRASWFDAADQFLRRAQPPRKKLR